MVQAACCLASTYQRYGVIWKFHRLLSIAMNIITAVGVLLFVHANPHIEGRELRYLYKEALISEGGYEVTCNCIDCR